MLDSSYLPLMQSLKNIDTFYCTLRSIKARRDDCSDVRTKRIIRKTVTQLKAELEFSNLCLSEIDED